MIAADPDRASRAPPARARLHVVIRGAVQGVGFRPFVYRLAAEMRLAGFVCNTPEGVCLEVEGAPERLEAFLLRIEPEKPPLASIQSLEPTVLDPAGFTSFEIRESLGGRASALVLPDVATCPQCLAEVLDPADRRYGYPFTNCTHCGPRYSIVESLPYDRARTSMRRFAMCPACEAEYHDPRDRRFHAQPNACPVCGPRLALWGPSGAVRSTHDGALAGAARALREGAVVAVKGLGGFHLMADARSDAVVRSLRLRKHREEKPFALMVPSLAAAEALCRVSWLEARLLRAPEAPIVLLDRRPAPPTPVAEAVAPGNPCLGLLLPYTPLHHLLLRAVGLPLVATSGNTTDEPICTDEHEALRRLAGIADLFLVHDRPIVRRVDDSVARVVLGREQVLRRARGYAPLPVDLASLLPPGAPPRTTLAVGGHLKNTVALSVGTQAFVGPHVGDLDTAAALDAFATGATDLARLYDRTPEAVAHDLHPDYASTQYAATTGLPRRGVQHHYAHVLACMAENRLRPPVLGVSWDGTGYGTDGTIWGGEFLRVGEEGFTRAAHLRPFPLPGGDRAVREPRRSALGLLYDLYGDDVFERETLPLWNAFDAAERRILRRMLSRGLQAPRTSSAGRLFDGVAALLGLRLRSGFEGQAAMELEFAARRGAERSGDLKPYPFLLARVPDTRYPAWEIDWRPMLRALVADERPADVRAARFHETLAAMVEAAARQVRLPRVALTGGCFQNRHLTEATIRRLRGAGFHPYWHQRIPPNDGGLSLGQLAAALLTELS